MEVVGPSHTCQLTDLPESRHGHAAVRLGDSVVVCGGLSGRHIHERSDKSDKSYRQTNIAKELPNAVRPVMQGRIRSFTFWPQLPSSLLYSGWREDKNSVAFSPLSANLTKTNYNPRHNRFIAVTKNLIVQSENLG